LLQLYFGPHKGGRLREPVTLVGVEIVVELWLSGKGSCTRISQSRSA